MKWKANVVDYSNWHDFLCLFPRIVDNHWVWMETIERKLDRNWAGTHSLYRLKYV